MLVVVFSQFAGVTRRSKAANMRGGGILLEFEKIHFIAIIDLSIYSVDIKITVLNYLFFFFAKYIKII